MPTLANILLLAMGAYAGVGLVVGTWFVLRGVRRCDTVARVTPRYVRFLWLPGALLLWPVVIPRCIRAKESL